MTEPTHILTATSGSVTVTTTLYGLVTADRIAAEQKMAQYRAEQLHIPPRVDRPRKVTRPIDRDDDYIDDGLNYGKWQ